MKTAYILFLSLVISVPILAQSQPDPPLDRTANKQFMRQLLKDGDGQYWVSQKVAESMLIRRVDPVFPHHGMIGRVSGTVIVEFEITKKGKVKYATAVSGPKFLQGPVIAAVEQWVFTPYMLNGKATIVATSFKLTVSNF